MRAQVDQLNARYRVRGRREAMHPARRRLDRIAARHLGEALAADLRDVLPDDGAVYVLRRVDNRVALDLSVDKSDRDIARHWGRQLSRDIRRQINRAGDAAGVVMRFADEASFIAAFVSDLLAGKAWGRWYYAPLAALRSCGKAEAIHRAIRDVAEDKAAVLAALRRLEVLDSVLAALGPAQCALLWRTSFAALPAAASSEPLRANRATRDRPPARRGTTADDDGLADRTRRAARPGAGARSHEAAKAEVLGTDVEPLETPWAGRAESEGPAWAPPPPSNEARPSRSNERRSAPGDGSRAQDSPAAHDARRDNRRTPSPIDLPWAGDATAADPRGLAPLFTTARQIYDALLFGQPPTAAARDDAALFAQFREDFAGPVDWREPAALSDVVLAAVRFLARQAATGLAGAPRPTGKALQRSLESVLAGLDWLDLPRLRAGLKDILGKAESNLPPGRDRAPEDRDRRGATRPRPGATPKQRALLGDLTAALESGVLRLNTAETDHAADALRLLAATVERDARWADDHMPPGLIELALAAGAALRRASDPEALLGAAGAEDPAGAAAREFAPILDDPALARMIGFGAPGMALLRAMVWNGHATITSSARAAHAPHGRGEPFEPLAPVDGPFPRRRTAAAEGWIATPHAGLLLLLRGMADLRLPSLAATAGYPAAEGSGPWPLLLALAHRLAAADPATDGRIDPAVLFFAGAPLDMSWAGLRAAWPARRGRKRDAFQRHLLRQLAGLRASDGKVLSLHRLRLPNGSSVVVGGDPAAGLWPLGCLVRRAGHPSTFLRDWIAAWEAAFGAPPEKFAAAASLMEEGGPAGVDAPIVLATAEEADQTALAAAFAALEGGRLKRAGDDLTVALAAIATLRIWARWLRGFSESSVPYLLDRFVRRTGRLRIAGDDTLDVDLAPSAFDEVLRMAGYLDPLEGAGWLEGRRVTFSSGGTGR